MLNSRPLHQLYESHMSPVLNTCWYLQTIPELIVLRGGLDLTAATVRQQHILISGHTPVSLQTPFTFLY